jgi:hypothetical protein
MYNKRLQNSNRDDAIEKRAIEMSKCFPEEQISMASKLTKMVNLISNYGNINLRLKSNTN